MKVWMSARKRGGGGIGGLQASRLSPIVRPWRRRAGLTSPDSCFGFCLRLGCTNFVWKSRVCVPSGDRAAKQVAAGRVRVDRHRGRCRERAQQDRQKAQARRAKEKNVLGLISAALTAREILKHSTSNAPKATACTHTSACKQRSQSENFTIIYFFVV